MPDPSLPPQKNILLNKSTAVVGAVLLCLAVVFFFRQVPPVLRWPARICLIGALGWLVFTAVQALRSWRFNGRNLVFSLILGAFFYAALHLICHVFIKLMSSRDDRLAIRTITELGDLHKTGIQTMLDGTSYEMYDREIGWVPRPGNNSEGATINRQGLRSLREYAIPAPDPAKRILCVGDSFTFGNVVGDTETYPYHAGQLRPDYEWVNLGISGACLTQCLLQYRKNGRKFGGKYVVIGFMTDDAKRTVNCFRPFLTPYNPFTKPFAKYSDGKFSIEPNPYQDISDYRKLLANEVQEIQRLQKMDYLTWSHQKASRNPVLRTAGYIYEAMHLDRSIDSLLGRQPPRVAVKTEQTRNPSDAPVDPYGRITWIASEQRWTKRVTGVDPYGQAIWNPESPGFVALTHVFDVFHNEIIADGRIPLIVVIPGPLDVENHVKQLPRVYGPLIGHLKAKGYHYFDFLDNLIRSHKEGLSDEALYVVRHFKGPINKELAAAIIEELHLP